MLNMQKLSKNKSQLIIDKDMTTSLHGVIFIKWWRQRSSTCCPLVSVNKVTWHEITHNLQQYRFDFHLIQGVTRKKKQYTQKIDMSSPNTTEQLSDWIHFFRFSSQNYRVTRKKGRIKQWIIWFSAGFQFCLSYFFSVCEFRMANVGEWKK